MDEYTTPSTPAQRMQSLSIVGFSMMMAGVIYVAVLYFITQDLPPDPEAAAPLTLPLAAAAVMAGLASVALPRVMARQPPAQVPNLSAEAEVQQAMSRYFTRTILAMALAEAVILIGFVLAFTAHEMEAILPFLVAGEALMLLHFPRQARLEAKLSPAAQAWLQQRTR